MPVQNTSRAPETPARTVRATRGIVRRAGRIRICSGLPRHGSANAGLHVGGTPGSMYAPRSRSWVRTSTGLPWGGPRSPSLRGKAHVLYVGALVLAGRVLLARP